MLGGTSPLSAVLGSAPTGDAIETSRYRNYAKSLASHGLHILLIAPGSKIPVDMRSSVQKRTDDTAAQKEAHEAGRPDWVKVKAKCGVHLGTDDPKLLTRYIDNYRKTYGDETPVNMAVAVGPSRLIIVDCDTEEQVAAFLSDAGIPADTPLPPTVRSPGQRDAEGNWAHYGGGHYWFTLPEGTELPSGSGSVTAPGGYAILWDGRYVLIPPSIRPEGAYGLAGQDYPAPDWIIERIRKHAEGRTDRRQEFGGELGELSENIDAWSQMVSWEDILEPAGWTMAARPDGCGCQVWTAPGAHASPKSATAHDTGCTFGRYSDVNAPLHIWTDNPGAELEEWIREHGSKTVTKLQLTAVLSYGGNVGTACAELGVIPKDDLGLDNDVGVRDIGVSMSNLDAPITLDLPFDNGGDLPGMQPYVMTDDGPRKIDGLKSPAVDAALERARQFAESKDGETYTWTNQDLWPYRVYEPGGLSIGFGDPADGVSWGTLPDGSIVTGHDAPEQNDSVSAHPVPEQPLAADAEPGRAKDQVVAPQVQVSTAELEQPSAQPVPEHNQTEESVSSESDDACTTEQTDNPHTLPNTDTPSDPPPNDPPKFTDEGGEYEDGVLEKGDQFMPRIALLDYWRDYPAPEYVVDGWIENGGMAAVIGPSGIGKTTVVLDILGAIATGSPWHGCATMKQRVLYMPGEGMSGSIQRMKAWERAHKADNGTGIAVAEGILRAGAPQESWAQLVRVILDNHIGMLVFDTFARMAVGVEENSANEVGKVTARLDQVRKLTGCTVLLLHHTGKASDLGRGSSALNGALDTEILVTGGWFDEGGTPQQPMAEGEPVTVRTSKQKNAACAPPQHLLMVPYDGSVIMAGASGEIGNVFDEMGTTRAIMPEPPLETAVRIAKVLDEFTAQGLTVAEASVAVQQDEWTARLGNASSVWKIAIRRAIDLGMRHDLFETLSGKPTGARYIRGGTGIEQFRKLTIDAGLTSE